MQVRELWRYPVKSLQGERLDAVDVEPLGLAGDRRYAIFDLTTGFGLTARRVPEMLFATARLDASGNPVITLPDGSIAVDDAALSTWLGRPVQLRSCADRNPRRYENPEDVETEEPASWYTFDGSDGAFHDSARAKVTVVSTGTLHGHAPRRFRANVLLEGAGEDALVGTDVGLGAATLTVTKAVGRCVMVTRPQPDGIGLDRDVLRWVHRTRGGVLAVGAVVARPGRLQVGDELRPHGRTQGVVGGSGNTGPGR